MKFKLDENLPGELVGDLKSLGHDADTVEDEGISGAPGETVVGYALRYERVLLTLDKGIANIHRYPKHVGIVLFRPATNGRGEVLTFIRAQLPELLQLDIEGRLTVVTTTGIRQR